MIDRTVILSTNDNPVYFLYLPYIQKAWNKLGWKTFTFYLGDKKIIKSDSTNTIIKIENISEYKECTLVQVSRLFGHKYCNGMIMTSDIDMMPLTNYWSPEKDFISCYGSDLTNYIHHPICYIAADASYWRQLIPEDSISSLLQKYPQAKSKKFEEYWYTDQDIITERINSMSNTKIIPRGFDNNLAQGRIDRIDWLNTFNRPGLKIDAHLPKKFDKKVVQNLFNLYL